MKVDKRSGGYRIRKMINGKNHSRTFDHKPTKREIDLWVSELLSQGAPSCDRGTFEFYALSYINSKDHVLSPATIRSYHGIVRNLSDGFLHTQLSDMTAETVQLEINDISSRKSPKTARNYHAFISPVISMFRPDLALHTSFPQRIEAETYVPTDEEVHKVLTAAKGKSYELMLYLGVYAMRLSEALCVTPEDLDGNMLHIIKSKVQADSGYVVKPYGKTESSRRTIYVDDYTAGLLRDQGIGFSGHPRKVLEYLYNLQDRIGVHRFKYHALRHYYASYAHSIGIPDAYIMAAGGWSSDHVLKRVYRHAQREKEEDMMKKISQNMFGQV